MHPAVEHKDIVVGTITVVLLLLAAIAGVSIMPTPRLAPQVGALQIIVRDLLPPNDTAPPSPAAIIVAVSAEAGQQRWPSRLLSLLSAPPPLTQCDRCDDIGASC